MLNLIVLNMMLLPILVCLELAPGYTFLPYLSLARAAARPRIAGEMDGLAEVGDAAHAAYERTRTDPVDAISETRLPQGPSPSCSL